MEIVTGHTGSEHITAVDDAMFNIAVFGDGNWVFDTNEKMAYEIETNNKVNIKSGDILMQGRHGRIPKNHKDACVIENGSQGQTRHDIIAIRYERQSSGVESMTTVVIKGTPGSTGKDPSLRTGDINTTATLCEMPLYRVVLNGLNIAKVERMTEVLPKLDRHAFNAPVTSLNSNSELDALSAAAGKNLQTQINSNKQEISASKKQINSVQTTANNAMPKSGGTFTGGVTVNGDIDAKRHVKIADGNKVVWGKGAMVFGNGAQHLYMTGSSEPNYAAHVGVHDGMWTLDPDVSGNLQLGTPNHKWGTVYAVNGAISTSDKNAKTEIKEIDDKYVDFFMRLKPVSYRLKDGKRTHVGFVSQDVEEAMKAVGLTDLDFAGFCRDVKTQRVAKKRKVKVINEVGEEVVESVTYYEDAIVPNEYIYSLRYDEFIALNTAVIQRIYKRLSALEGGRA